MAVLEHAKRRKTRPGETPQKGEGAMMEFVKKLVREESGQDLAEYGIALAVIAAGAALIAVAIAGNVQILWSNAQSAVEEAVAQEA